MSVLADEVATVTATQAEEAQIKSAVELTLHVQADEVATQVEETEINSAVELTYPACSGC